ncbi:cuticular protein 4 [Andrena cerasifolii]|uniref:cuticular protein 4 n=1 Tax=Andrena cerasifolii TaxID=2819439 RepID=UPI0040378A19
MVVKSVTILLAIVAFASLNAAAIPVPTLPVAKLGPVVPVHPEFNYDPHPQYTYAYDVQDSLTGDTKSQHESRNGDVVSGSYSFIEADGTRRTVEYTADPVNGFNAVVHREPVVVVKPAYKVAPVAFHP